MIELQITIRVLNFFFEKIKIHFFCEKYVHEVKNISPYNITQTQLLLFHFYFLRVWTLPNFAITEPAPRYLWHLNNIQHSSVVISSAMHSLDVHIALRRRSSTERAEKVVLNSTRSMQSTKDRSNDSSFSFHQFHPCADDFLFYANSIMISSRTPKKDSQKISETENNPHKNKKNLDFFPLSQAFLYEEATGKKP